MTAINAAQNKQIEQLESIDLTISQQMYFDEIRSELADYLYSHLECNTDDCDICVDTQLSILQKLRLLCSKVQEPTK